MPKTEEMINRVVNAVFRPGVEYIRVMDWEGKSLPFILADEITIEEKPTLMENKKEKI
jgi:hypothetical protein